MLKVPDYPLLAKFISDPPSWARQGRVGQILRKHCLPSNHYYKYDGNLGSIQTSLDFALNSPLIYRPTKTRVHIYGSHHSNHFCWKEVQTIIKRVKNPLICLELPDIKYGNYLKRVKKFGVDPEKVRQKSANLNRASYDLIAPNLSSAEEEYLWERGCIHGNEFASAIQCRIRKTPEFIDVGAREQQDALKRLVSKVKFTQRMQWRNQFDIEACTFLRVFYGIEDPTRFLFEPIAMMQALHPPTLTQELLMREICPKFIETMWEISIPREMHMVRRLHNICCLNSDQNIVAIVGNGHVPGILEYWDRHIPDDLFARLQAGNVDWKVMRADLPQLTDPSSHQNRLEIRRMVESPKKYCT